MQAQFLRRFFAPTAIILAFAAAMLLAPLTAIAANAPEVPAVRCQVFNGPVPGFDYSQAIGIAGESPSNPHVITTYFDRLEGGRQYHFWTTIEDQNDPASRLARTIDAAREGAGVQFPIITTTGPTSRQIDRSGIPESIRRALYECDGAILLLVASVEGITLGGSQVSDQDFNRQVTLAVGAAEVARREFAPDFTLDPSKKKSSSGGTIAAIGGAALVAGGLTWLLWPDAKQTIQPYAQGKNDGRGYAAGIQARLGRNQSLILHQTDGPRENRFTGVRWELRW